MTLFLILDSYNYLGDNMNVKIFDFESESDLEKAINKFIDDDMKIIDIKYQVAIGVCGEEQLYCFSAMIMYL